MIEMPMDILALIAGVLIGAIFFGGLWWTIRRGLSSMQPALWFSGSLLLRTLIAVIGFYFASRGDWRRLVSCLLGFVIGRILVVRLTQASSGRRGQAMQRGTP